MGDRSVHAALGSLFDASPDGMVIIDQNQRILAANQAFSDLLQAAPEAVVGTSLEKWLDHLDGESPRKWSEARAEALRDGVSRANAFETSRNGTERHLTVTAYSDRSAEGAVVIGVWRDVSEQAKGLVSRQSIVLEAVNQVFQKALTCKTLEELAQTCITVCQEVTGSKLALMGELNGDGTFDTLAFTDPGWAECQMDQSEALRRMKGMAVRGVHLWALRAGEAKIVNDPGHCDESVGVPAGHPAIHSYLGVPLLRGERTVGMIGLANKDGGYGEDDSTLVEAVAAAIVESMIRKRAELEADEHAAELLVTNEALKQYAHAISHDIRAPLRAVRQYADFLLEDLGKSLEGDPREYLEELGQAVDRAETLVEDLLSLTRLGRQRADWEQIGVAEHLRDLTKEMDLDEEVSVEVSGECPRIDVEPILFQQVFKNLIDNAVKFNESSPKKVVVTCVEADHGIVDVRVQDNGIGIDDRFFDRIFGVFDRLHTDEEYEGTGIGLAIVKKAVTQLGGMIRIESTLGKGSTFTVSLPKKHERGTAWTKRDSWS